MTITDHDIFNADVSKVFPDGNLELHINSSETITMYSSRPTSP